MKWHMLPLSWCLGRRWRRRWRAWWTRRRGWWWAHRPSPPSGWRGRTASDRRRGGKRRTSLSFSIRLFPHCFNQFLYASPSLEFFFFLFLFFFFFFSWFLESASSAPFGRNSSIQFGLISAPQLFNSNTKLSTKNPPKNFWTDNNKSAAECGRFSLLFAPNQGPNQFSVANNNNKNTLNTNAEIKRSKTKDAQSKQNKSRYQFHSSRIGFVSFVGAFCNPAAVVPSFFLLAWDNRSDWPLFPPLIWSTSPFDCQFYRIWFVSRMLTLSQLPPLPQHPLPLACWRGGKYRVWGGGGLSSS